MELFLSQVSSTPPLQTPINVSASITTKSQEQGERIHFAKDGSSCKHCNKYDELKRKLDEGHKLLLKMKMEEGGFDEGVILLMQDFTQLETAKGGFTQDPTFCG